jgi:hypothetical protein
MPVAMWLLSERKGKDQADAIRELERRSTKYSPDTWLQLPEYRINYSYLREIRKEIITPENASSIRAFTSKIRNRVILLGDLEDASDQFCHIPQQKPLSGALIHACSVATLNRGMLMREVNETIGWKLRIAIAIFVLSSIMSIRLIHTYSKLLREWDYHYLEILLFGMMSILIYLVFTWETRKLRVYWPDFLWISLALFICPFITEPFYRTCAAVPKVLHEFVLTFVESGVKR